MPTLRDLLSSVIVAAVGILNGLPDQDQQGIGIIRLAKIIMAARGAATAKNVGPLHAGQNNHGNGTRFQIVGQLFAYRDSVGVGQVQIQQDQRGLIGTAL